MKVDKIEYEGVRKQLRKLLPPGSTVHSIIRSVSSSGMSRRIDFYIVKKEGGKIQFNWITSRMAKLGIGRYNYNDRRAGLVIGGCGMDMAFHCVYTLGRILYPDGFKLRKGQCGRNGDTSGFDKDGGYALKSEII